MKVIITGVAGFIGSRVARKFIEEGHKVIGIDNLSGGNFNNIPKEVDFHNIDLVDASEFSKLPQDAQIILHLAGQSSGEISFHFPQEDLRKNTVSTLNLIKFGIKNKVKKLIYASSMSVYGDFDCNKHGVKEECILEPKSCYGIGKLSSEQYLNVFKDKLPFVSLRMFNVYGPGQDMNNMSQGMVSIYLSQALKYRKIIVKGSLLRFRDFIFIDDVVESWFRASFCEEALNQAINIGTGKKTTVKEILEVIKSITEVEDVKIENGTPCDQLGIYSDNTKLNQLMKMSHYVDLKDGLERFLDWAKENEVNKF